MRANVMAMATRCDGDCDAVLCLTCLHSVNCKRFMLTHPELCPCTTEFPLGEEGADDIPSDHLTFEYHGHPGH